MTTDYVDEVYSKNEDLFDYYRVCLPMAAQCCTTMSQSYWLPWEEEKKELWVRDMPRVSINESNHDFDFYQKGMWDYEFLEKFSHWMHTKNKAGRTACFVGIRTQESFNRWRAIYSDKNYIINDQMKLF